MNISQAHEISIISFLEKEGFRPCRVYGDNYWYRSPLREEKIASFKVNRDINRWYDYGMSEGGDIGIGKAIKGFANRISHAGILGGKKRKRCSFCNTSCKFQQNTAKP